MQLNGLSEGESNTLVEDNYYYPCNIIITIMLWVFYHLNLDVRTHNKQALVISI